MTIVLIDVDGTLVPGPSCERRFLGALWADKKLGLRQMTAAAWFTVAGLLRFGRHVFRSNKAYLTGLYDEDVAKLADIFVARSIIPVLRASMLDRIEQHRAAGDRIALLTGTIEAIALPLAREIGAASFHATRCAMAGRRYTAAVPLDHPFGATKLAAAHALCAKLGGALNEATAYGDSHHDLPLLRAVRRPVAVAPDRILRNEALARHWEILGG